MPLDLPSWKLMGKKLLLRVQGSDSSRDRSVLWTHESEVSLSRALLRFFDPARLQQRVESEEHASDIAKPSSSSSKSALGANVDEILGRDGPLRTSIIYLLASMSRRFMQQLNHTEVHGRDIMEAALTRPEGQALITVCNHVAAMDDPLVMSMVIPPAFYSRPESIRWTLCATDRCFKYNALVPLFRAAKVLPVQRGGGMNQPGMQAAEKKLKQGQWVHIFPEGTRSQSRGQMGAVRKGIGRLVAACERPPLVVPFVHSGMEDVMPRGKVLPTVGKEIRVLVGQPIPMDDLLAASLRQGWTEDKLHTAIAARVSRHLVALKAQLDLRGEAFDPLDSARLNEEPLGGSVSSLDHFDDADLRWEHRASMWEKAKFRMQHRAGRLGLPFTASASHRHLEASSSSIINPPAMQSVVSTSQRTPQCNNIAGDSLLSMIRPRLSNTYEKKGSSNIPSSLLLSAWLQSTSLQCSSTLNPLAFFNRHRTEGLMHLMSV